MMPVGQVQVPFPDSSFPGTPGHQQEAAGRIINAYIEPLGAGAPAASIYRRAPGLRNFGTTTRSGFRGMMQVGGTLFTAWNNRLVTFNSAGGAAADMGALTGSAKGFFARNARGPTPPPPGPDIVFCDPDGNYAKFTVGGAITTNYDPDLPAPNSVCSIDGYFIFTTPEGKVFASDFQDTNIDPLSFATAESRPDGLLRAVPWAGQLFLFGPFTTEVWQNAGTTPFPFARAGVVIPRGLAGPYCVTGFEDNFSRALVWVADDNTVVMAEGYTPAKISPPDLDGLIERVTDKRLLEFSSFISRGHAFLLLSSPTWSWVFDLNTRRWAERNSYQSERSRIIGGSYAFDRWLCGDTLTGNIHEITNDVHTEPPRSTAITGAVAGTVIAGIPRIRLTVANAGLVSATIIVVGVLGTTEANGIWSSSYIDPTHIELAGSSFVNAYTSGGTIEDAYPQPFRWRLESGAVENFPVGARVGRADFEFVTGVGMITAPANAQNVVQNIVNILDSGAVDAHQIDVLISNTARLLDNLVPIDSAVRVKGVTGTVEANGGWPARFISYNKLRLLGSTFTNAWTGGGTVTFLTPLEPIETDPVVEISWSDDGGQTYYAPITRKLGRQERTRELVSLISCTGRSSWNARRWRLDISDPVYVGFMAGYQQLSPKVSDIG
jgi:hypothetical protein